MERFARRYTPAVLLLAALVAVVPPALGGQPWGFWFYQALTLLIISCPCALVISTPVSMVCGLTAAARRGVLIKGGEHLERGQLHTGQPVGGPAVAPVDVPERRGAGRPQTHARREVAHVDAAGRSGAQCRAGGVEAGGRRGADGRRT